MIGIIGLYSVFNNGFKIQWLSTSINAVTNNITTKTINFAVSFQKRITSCISLQAGMRWEFMNIAQESHLSYIALQIYATKYDSTNTIKVIAVGF